MHNPQLLHLQLKLDIILWEENNSMEIAHLVPMQVVVDQCDDMRWDARPNREEVEHSS